MNNQNTVFLQGEGNAWYRRNQNSLAEDNRANGSTDVRYLCDTLLPFKDSIRQILEIGCSNGIRLEVLAEAFAAQGAGIDPSSEAVSAGNSRVKSSDVTLCVGVGDNLPYEPHSFDFVYFAFSLYLFDRSTLLRSLAEADRVLKPGGFLAITDFDPSSPHKRKYAHLEGLYSYKQDYAKFYTESGQYALIGKRAYSSRSAHFDQDADERVATQVLFKERDPYLTRG